MELDATLNRLAAEPDLALDIAEVALCLARDENPRLDVDGYLSELAAMAREAQPLLRGDLAARVAGLSRYLFHDMGFRGNTRDYYDPRNSYLNHVLDRRMGIPISLSVLAVAIGTRAGLVVAGVALPGHFVVKAVENGREILFDPFHGGRRLEPEDCETLVAQATGSPFRATATSFEAASTATIVERMLRNLKAIYLRQSDFRRAVRVIDHLRRLCPDKIGERRDLGLALLLGGQPGRALDQLEAYLSAEPESDDRAAVQRLIKQARAELANRN